MPMSGRMIMAQMSAFMMPMMFIWATTGQMPRGVRVKAHMSQILTVQQLNLVNTATALMVVRVLPMSGTLMPLAI